MTMRARSFAAALLAAGLIAAAANPAYAQAQDQGFGQGQGQGGDTPGQRGNRVVQPYI